MPIAHPCVLAMVFCQKEGNQSSEEPYGHCNLDAVNEMLNADEPTFERAAEDRLRIGKPRSGSFLS